MKFKITESQFKTIISKTENQIMDLLLNEGRNEDDALKILKNSGVENYQEIFDYIKSIDKSKNYKMMPIIASFYVKNPSVPSEVIIKTFLKISKTQNFPEISLVSADKIKLMKNYFSVDDFLGFKNFIDHYFYEESEEDVLEKKILSVDENLIFENNKFIVYEAPSGKVCVDLFGRDNEGRRYAERPFCIGVTANWYHTHRDPSGNWQLTFYVIVDKEKFEQFKKTGDDHPSLINVLGVRKKDTDLERKSTFAKVPSESKEIIEYFVWDKNNKGDGSYVEGFSNVEEYVNYLEKNGLNVDKLFSPKPYVDISDSAIDRMQANQTNDSLFDSLTPKQKYTYITTRATTLTPHQIKFILNYMPPKILENFVKNFENLGDISQEAFKLLSTNLQKSFINSKLTQLFIGNTTRFKEDKFFDYMLNDDLKSYAVTRIANALSGKLKDPVSNRKGTKQILYHLNPAEFFESLKGEVVVELTFKEFKLGELPENLGEYISEVRRLDLKGLNITFIPKSIGMCKNLIDLHITDCNNLTTIPDEIGELSALEDFIINGSQLNKIPSTIGQLTNLSSISITNSPIKTIPIEMNKCVNLDFINLSNNAIENVSPGLFLNDDGIAKIESGETDSIDENLIFNPSFFVLEGNPLSDETLSLIEILTENTIIGITT